MRHARGLLALGGALALVAAAAGGERPEAIKMSPTHPQYWQYDGRTVLLLGGSKEDNLFQISDIEGHLDLLAASGGNYVRCTMSSRDEGNPWPFFFDENEGAYDLGRWNDEYWARFERLLSEASRRGIVVQVEIWATFDFYRDNWGVNPFNPKNNSNYTAERTKLPIEVPTHPIYRDNRFFWSQNNHQRGQAHWDNGLRQIERLRRANHLRPVNNVKTYGADGGRHGGDTNEAIAKFIRSALFGSAAVRFHRPPSGIGLSSPAQAVIRSVRDLSDRMEWFDGAPHDDLLGEREENEAYCRALPDREYAVYFPDGGRVTLDLGGLDGDASLIWRRVLESGWSEPRAVQGGSGLPLEPPAPGHWIALVKEGGIELSRP